MIRQPSMNDTQMLAAICHDALGHHTSADILSKKIAALSDRSEYYIRVFQDEVTHEVKGFIQAQKYELLYGDNGWNIIALAVLPSCQNNGIGKALLTALEQHAAARGDAFIRLNSRTDRQQAHGFYEHMGYTCDKEQKRFIKYLG